MRDIIIASVHYMNIQKPFKIILRNKLKGNAMGLHYQLMRKNKLIGHRIEVSLDTDNDLRDCDTLIMHEFIHAWQAENGYLDHHGASFQSMAKQLQKRFGIMNLYIPGVDVEPE